MLPMIFLVALSGCHALRMGVPADLVQAEALPIDRPAITSDFGKGNWTFGTIKAADIKKGWSKTSESGSDRVRSLKAGRPAHEIYHGVRGGHGANQGGES